MIPVYGPAGRIHWPRFNKRGCYHGDPAHVCAVCYGRLIWLLLRNVFGGVRGE